MTAIIGTLCIMVTFGCVLAAFILYSLPQGGTLKEPGIIITVTARIPGKQEYRARGTYKLSGFRGTLVPGAEDYLKAWLGRIAGDIVDVAADRPRDWDVDED